MSAINRRQFTYGVIAAAGSIPSATQLIAQTQAKPHKPMLQLQQEFLDLRFGMYIHLNMATFEQREWGDPKASPQLFNPAHLDTDQWAQAARSAGMTYGCLSTKHHDGFCLWPTATTSPSVKDAPFQHDIVRAYVDSFRRHGLKVCLYLSIFDLRADIRPYQITPRKVELIKAQLTELLTNYGEITAMIFDGWNAPWTRITYDQLPFREIYDHVKHLQPNCLVTDYNASQYPGSALYYTDIRQYEQHAGQKIPADSLVPSQSATTLQSEWFWKRDYPTQELRSARQIVNDWLIPFNEQHCNLILNVAPNTDGRFDDNAIKRLAEIGQLWKHPGTAPRLQPSVAITTPNLAFAKPSFASSSPDTIGPDLANDNKFDSFWICDQGVCDQHQNSSWLEIAFERPTAFNTVSIVEPRYLQQYGPDSRIASYRLQLWDNGRWTDILNGRTPSTFQLHQFRRVTAQRVRLTLEGIGRPPGIAEFGVYNEPITT
ncbi:alpha-L-fucosidase [Tunturiibacter gelidoferens]|uniref:Alpha-L-fucosidase n=1 Tax=Tunturiibacter gelidiferens TaxID=3069689 RepID=A0ACC5NWG5_9BACT|nr:alpha-L-fucosidase [Edaphobacter lichenicola]MBB5338942.1 alpha-L-fucosidase [Edaphobacter lichenicola]